MNNSYLKQLKLASQDFFAACYSYKLWSYLAWTDIQLRYRGSVLGPFWITLSMTIFIAALNIVYGRLFHVDTKTLLPYLTTGLLTWNLITSSISESSDVFISAKALVDNIKLPYLIYVFRLMTRNIIIFFHNAIVYIIVAIVFNIPFNANTILFIPGLLILVLSISSVCLIFSLLGTRFRDLPPLINNLMTLLFFISPVAWQSKMIGEASLIIQLNPIVYYLELIRAPLLGQAPNNISWFFGLGFMFFSVLFAFLLFARVRARIPFWI